MTRMSRTVGLVLLGGAALSACCCVLPRPQPPPPQYDENGNLIPQAQTTSGSTGYRRSHAFWVPWYWGGSSYSTPYRGGPGYRSPPSRGGGGAAPVSLGGAVSRGGFGTTGGGLGAAA